MFPARIRGCKISLSHLRITSLPPDERLSLSSHTLRSLSLSLLLLANISSAQKVPLTPVDMLSLVRVESPELSPDGTQLVFVHKNPVWSKNRHDESIWLQRLGSDRAIQLTYGRDQSAEPTWSPDSRRIAFIAEPHGESKEQLFLLELGAGDAEQVTNHPTSVSNPRWNHDGTEILFLASDLSPQKQAEQEGREHFRHFIEPYDSPANRHLWRFDLATGKCGRLTSGDFHVRSYSLAPDGTSIVLERAPTALQQDIFKSTIWKVDSDGNNLVQVTTTEHEHYDPKVSPDGKRVLFLAGIDGSGNQYVNQTLLIVDYQENSSAEIVLPDFPYRSVKADWGPDSKTVYLLATQGTHTEIFEVDLVAKTFRTLTNGLHRINSGHYCRTANRYVIDRQTATNAGDFWMLDLNTTGPLQQITHLFDNLAEDFLLPEQRLVSWNAEDGQEIEGLLTLPLDYDGQTRCPLVVQSHGGPRSCDQYGIWKWNCFQPVLAGMGYATLRVNYRGSAGYGNEFMGDMVGNYFRTAHQDVLDGVDHLIEQGIADPNRLAKMGWSAGGHMTNKVITVTDRFKAASSGAGAVDWVSMYGESDLRFRRTYWFGGTPWQQDAPLDAYRDQSPLKDMWRVSTPTLIFVGGKDVRVPPTQSILLKRALSDHGVPNELYIAPNQKHGWGPPKQRLFKINAELEWFERYVNQREYQWQEPPEED